MAAQRATTESGSLGRSALIVAAVLAVAFAGTLIFRSTQPDMEAAAEPTAAPAPERVTPTSAQVPTLPVSTPPPPAAAPRSSFVPMPLVEQQVIDAAVAVDPAPLGTYVVAKAHGGASTRLQRWQNDQAPLEIPVFDQPYGQPRGLVCTHHSGQPPSRYPLLHAGPGASPLVLRVVAGGPDDDWIQVQAPVFPHHQTVWVQSLYFDFGFTPQRVEIDLAGRGHLRLIDGGAIMVDSPIAMGRPGAETPVGVSYVVNAQSSRRGYGVGRFELASFNSVSDAAITRTFVHGTDSTASMGRAISDGNVRVPNDKMADVIRRVEPGTPVVIFDSSQSWSTIEAVTSTAVQPATTRSFLVTSARVDDDQPAQQCPARDRGVSPVAAPDRTVTQVPVGSVFLTAKPGAGQELVDIGEVVPVYDEPGGPKRMLVDSNPIDNIALAVPIYDATPFGQPTVLRVVQGAPGDEWVQVQAPIRPHRRLVWIRSDDFDWGQTLKRIEVDLGRDGLVTLFDRNEELISSLAVYGRETRPTTLHDTYVEQAFEGRRLSPAYGTYILTLASFSEALGTFGGGGLPGQSLHGTNQPEMIGMRVSSGGIRVPDEIIEFIYDQPGIVGANVIIFDSGGTGREAAIRLQRFKTWSPARTTTFPRTNMLVAGVTSYS